MSRFEESGDPVEREDHVPDRGRSPGGARGGRRVPRSGRYRPSSPGQRTARRRSRQIERLQPERRADRRAHAGARRRRGDAARPALGPVNRSPALHRLRRPRSPERGARRRRARASCSKRHRSTTCFGRVQVGRRRRDVHRPGAAGTLAGSPSGVKRAELTRRERDVLRLLADGLSERGDREQAVHLGGDGSLARAQGDGQARCGHADAGGRPGAARPADRLTRAPSTRRARRCGAIRARGCGRGRTRRPRRRAPIPASVQTSPETSPSDAPAATSRAAAIPWVSGRQRPIALIQPGSTDERDVDAAEEQHQEVGEVRGEEEVLRAQPDRAEQHPEARARRDRHQEDHGERRHRVEPGPEAEQQRARAERERRDEQPVQQHRHAATEEDRARGWRATRAAGRVSRTSARSRPPSSCRTPPTSRRPARSSRRCRSRRTARARTGRAS